MKWEDYTTQIMNTICTKKVMIFLIDDLDYSYNTDYDIKSNAYLFLDKDEEA